MKYLYIILGFVIFATIIFFHENENSTACKIANEKYEKIKHQARGEMAAFTTFQPAKKMPNITYFDGQNQQQSLENQNLENGGKIILLNIWATWCVPCLEEMPYLEELAKDMAKDLGEKFQVLAISIDRGKIDKIKQFYKKLNIQNLSLAHDPSLQSFKSLQQFSLVFGLPATILINEENCAIGALNGPAKWNSQQAKNLIKAAIN